MKRALPSTEVTVASKLFDRFFSAEYYDDIVTCFQNLCTVLQISPGHLSKIYPAIKTNVKSLSASNLFQVLDKKISNNIYNQQLACRGSKVVIVGGGPCGLRTAIECQLLGASSIVLEKRTDISRNNVLHLWPFVIEDLKLLGLKVFFPKFCTGSMDHISIRRLQTILLKISLVLGARVHAPCEFLDLIEPGGMGESSTGWRVRVDPPNHPLNSEDIDVLVGAEGKRVTVPGFKRKEFRGKLAIAITANFVNNRTTAEAVVEEISGVAFVYKQDFFNSLYDELGIALENIVYYKDETHYFVMTTKKHSLLDRKVLRKDYQDPVELLSQKNINQKELLEYIRDACDFCTDYQLPDLEFALNRHGQPDVAIFDFTSMFAASNSSYVREKHGKQILCALVGDGLLEPFWPTGSGCARGFLGVLDCCHMMSEWCEGSKSVLQILAERESIFRLLPQTTSENLAKDLKNYTVDPTSRYPNLNKFLYGTHQVERLYITDNSSNKNVPRRNYIPALDPHLYQRRNSSKFLEMTSSRGVYDDLDYEDDTPAFDFQELRCKILAESKADNEQAGASEYLNNRAKMIKNEEQRKKAHGSIQRSASGSSSRQGKVETGEKVDRLAAMKKISDTFGYGEGKVGQKKRLQPSSSGTSLNVRKLSDSSPKMSPQQTSQKTLLEVKKKTNPIPRRQPIPKFNFKAQTMPQRSEIEIDPELDVMLAQLETDEEFQKMTDNEQVAWLESLFFLDSGSRNARSGLVAPKPRRDPSPQRREKSSIYQRKASEDYDDYVSSKSLKVQSNKGSINEPRTPVTQSESSEHPGLNKDLCALAQQFFANDKSLKKTAKKPIASVKPQPQVVKPATQRRSVTEIPERASFETSDEHFLPEDEDDSFPFQRRFGEDSCGPPPVPERSDQPKATMLRLMKNATKVLKS